jgi:hypothetical protein
MIDGRAIRAERYCDAVAHAQTERVALAAIGGE